MEPSNVHRNVTAKETLVQALHRLAGQARELDLQVFRYDLTNGGREYFVTSHSEPGRLHRVTMLSCDCPGFQRHQRCSHFAALLDAIGELPPLDPIETAARQARQAEITTARIEVARLRRIAKSTADFHNLEAAKRRLTDLIEGDLVIQRPTVPAMAA